jgi:hypothetical protein
MSAERLDWYLWVFEQWHFGEGIFAGGSSYGTGYDSRASGGIGGTASREFDSMYADSCRRCAEAVSALVDGLPLPERAAVGIKHLGLASVFRFREPLDAVYQRAREHLGRGLSRRGFE